MEVIGVSLTLGLPVELWLKDFCNGLYSIPFKGRSMAP